MIWPFYFSAALLQGHGSPYLWLSFLLSLSLWLVNCLNLKEFVIISLPIESVRSGFASCLTQISLANQPDTKSKVLAEERMWKKFTWGKSECVFQLPGSQHPHFLSQIPIRISLIFSYRWHLINMSSNYMGTIMVMQWIIKYSKHFNFTSNENMKIKTMLN